MTQIQIEILKLCSSFLTPLLVLIIGFVVSKRIKKSKLDVLKEKEWHVKWAEIFLRLATEFNENTTIIICSLYSLQYKKGDKKDIEKRISNSIDRILEVEWHIRTYVQFSRSFESEVISIQTEIAYKIHNLISTKQGDLEEIRQLQFRYNKSVRKAHAEILRMDTIDNIKEKDM